MKMKLRKKKPKSYRPPKCLTCGWKHCFWCGLKFVNGADSTHPASPTRDHVRQNHHGGRAYHADDLKIVPAHRACNTRRGLNGWVPFHSSGEKPQYQAETLMYLQRVLNVGPDGETAS